MHYNLFSTQMQKKCVFSGANDQIDCQVSGYFDAQDRYERIFEDMCFLGVISSIVRIISQKKKKMSIL